MLRKLLKHEFRATARVMGPLFLVILVLALGANLSIRFMLDADSFIPNLLGGLLMMAFVIGMTGLIIMSIVLMVNRFRTNLMGDEGYVMFTLPASSHQLVWSKIIVSTVWFIATGIVECAALLICAADLDLIQEIFSSDFFFRVSQVIQELVQEYGLNLPVMALELIVLCLVGCAVLCLEFYAAMAVGHSFANHKMALSVVFFFGFQFVMQLAGGLILNSNGLWESFYYLDGMESFHQMMGISIVISLVTGVIYYFITSTMLKKRLNLQ
ncbi:hypothetical protein QVN85_00335 [Oscillibacter valericigenes]|jgi:hypothetical protein|uniref:hypothetical protein n=1 Tax=Oscillibacter ruminantium TaxID=1263547 RepID=UPI000319A9D6|nr:hypothetical protein [Oscillibacter ruminantium]MDN0031340.1 hypothetical protein [Oscillibacter valericigenes]MEA5041706.1 hypothetical protein [Oscillibacter ruminantium]